MSPGAGDSRTVESVFLRFPYDSSLRSGLLSDVYLVTNVTATSVPVLTSLTFFEMLAT